MVFVKKKKCSVARAHNIRVKKNYVREINGVVVKFHVNRIKVRS